MATSKLLFGLCLLACGPAWSREAATPAACAAAAQSAPIVAAKASLDAADADLRSLLKLADAWSDAGCFGEAMQVLKAGEASHPRDKELQARLQVAQSLVSEQSYFDNMDSSAKDARYSRAGFRCSKLSDLAACDEGLAMHPADVNLMTAKGDALVQLKRPAEAIAVYRGALGGAADRDALDSKIAAAETQRHALLEICETHAGEIALHACDSARLRGAPDEAIVLRRTGLLLQSDNQLSPALDVFIAAAHLHPADRSVALAIVSLSESTGRKDALTLSAEGSALMTLGRPGEALEPLREAVKLAPDLADAKSELRLAERAAGKSERVAASFSVVSAPPKLALRRYSNEAPASMSN